jgi:hypothetical protein
MNSYTHGCHVVKSNTPFQTTSDHSQLPETSCGMPPLDWSTYYIPQRHAGRHRSCVIPCIWHCHEVHHSQPKTSYSGRLCVPPSGNAQQPDPTTPPLILQQRAVTQLPRNWQAFCRQIMLYHCYITVCANDGRSRLMIHESPCCHSVMAAGPHNPLCVVSDTTHCVSWVTLSGTTRCGLFCLQGPCLAWAPCPEINPSWRLKAVRRSVCIPVASPCKVATDAGPHFTRKLAVRVD